MNSTSSNEILESLNQGDEKSISILYEKYSERLFISAYNMIKNKEVCEDIIQEVFINIWKKRGDLKIKTSLESYLYASVMYGVYGYYRKNNDKINVDLLEGFNTSIEYSNPETKLIQDELVAQINSIVESLPEKCRMVFEMSRNEQLSHKEISIKLSVSTKTVETHITKALKAIRFSLGNTFLLFFLYYTLSF